MPVNEDDIAKVRATVVLSDIVGEVVTLKRAGNQQWKGLCPFHEEKSPSFSVNDTQGLAFCFGCQWGGDAISFVRETQRLGFADAVDWLGRRYNIEVRHEGEPDNEPKRAVLYSALETICRFYEHTMWDTPAGKPAVDYLAGRGFDPDVLRALRVGWAPDAQRAAVDELKANRFDDDTIKATGVAYESNRHGLLDHLRARIVFPIADMAGNVVGFGGRIMPDDPYAETQPKYKNTSETRLYSKSRVLFGADTAKRPAAQANRVVLCEGYLDVAAFRQAGIGETVAVCGTATGEAHARMLGNMAKSIVLAYDSDTAGTKATDRFHQWEQSLNVNLYVAELPAGKDPGDLVTTPDLLVEALAAPKTLLAARVDRAIDQVNAAATPEDRAALAAVVAGIIAEHPSPIVRADYETDAARRLNIPVDALRAEHAARTANQPPRPAPAAEDSSQRPTVALPPLPELAALAAVRANNDAPGWMHPACFTHPDARAAFEIMTGRLVPSGDTEADTLIGNRARNVLAAAAQNATPPDTVAACARLVELAVGARINRLKGLVAQDPDGAAALIIATQAAFDAFKADLSGTTASVVWERLGFPPLAVTPST